MSNVRQRNNPPWKTGAVEAAFQAPSRSQSLQDMPLITIKLAQREQPTPKEQKAELIARVTEVMVDVLGKRAADVTVLIEELNPDNWGQGGLSATVVRQARAAGKSQGGND